MILVKSNGSNERHKIYKYDLQTQFEPEQVIFVDEENTPADKLYKISNEKIEILNKRLERARLLARAIECSFNRAATSMLKTPLTTPLKKGKVKGHFIKSIDDDNGIFIH